MGAVAKSYMRKGFLLYEETRKYLTIYEEAVTLVIYDYATDPFLVNFLIYEENSIFFISVWGPKEDIFDRFYVKASGFFFHF
jgi:hypothetical protein